MVFVKLERQSAPFNAAGQRAGMYFYVLRTGGTVETRKMVVVVTQNVCF
jgi:hypothetical protein